MSLLQATQPCDLRPPRLRKLGLRHIDGMKARWRCESCGQVWEWICTWAGCGWWRA